MNYYSWQLFDITDRGRYSTDSINVCWLIVYWFYSKEQFKIPNFTYSFLAKKFSIECILISDEEKAVRFYCCNICIDCDKEPSK